MMMMMMMMVVVVMVVMMVMVMMTLTLMKHALLLPALLPPRVGTKHGDSGWLRSRSRTNRSRH